MWCIPLVSFFYYIFAYKSVQPPGVTLNSSSDEMGIILSALKKGTVWGPTGGEVMCQNLILCHIFLKRHCALLSPCDSPLPHQISLKHRSVVLHRSSLSVKHFKTSNLVGMTWVNEDRKKQIHNMTWTKKKYLNKFVCFFSNFQWRKENPPGAGRNRRHTPTWTYHLLGFLLHRGGGRVGEGGREGYKTWREKGKVVIK